MELFGLVFLFVALVLIGIGIAVGLFACALAAILLGLGIVSSSFFIGLRSGRPAAGFRAFLLQCGIFAGVAAGAVCAWLAQSFFSAYGSGWPVLIYGAIGGAVAGICVALLLDAVARRLGRAAASGLKSTALERPGGEAKGRSNRLL